MLTIHLEESDCFAAWVSAREVGIGQTVDSTDPKCMLDFFSPITYHAIKYALAGRVGSLHFLTVNSKNVPSS